MKRLFCIILCITFMAAVFSGCRSDKDSAKSTETAESVELKYNPDYNFSGFDASTVRAFDKLCTAVKDYQSEVSFNLAMADNVMNLFYTSFPLFALVQDTTAKSDGSGILITYKYTEEEHKKIVSDFTSSVEKIMTECGYGEVSDSEFVLKVYSYIAQNFGEDSSVTNVVNTAIKSKGVSSTVTGLFEFIVRQADIPAGHLVSSEPSLLGKSISLVFFSDSFYYFDVFSELSDNSGKALKYFAMDSDRAKLKKLKYLTTDRSEPLVIDDKEFEKLKDSVSYELQDSKAVVKLKNGKTFNIDLT